MSRYCARRRAGDCKTTRRLDIGPSVLVLHKCEYKSRADELRLNELCLRQRDENMARAASQIATVAASAAIATMVAS